MGGGEATILLKKRHFHPTPIFAQNGGATASSVILIVNGRFPPSLVEPGVGGRMLARGGLGGALTPGFRVFISLRLSRGESVGSVIIEGVDTVHNSNHS